MTLIDLGPRSGKFADVQADALGWLCVWQDEADGELTFAQLRPDGERRTHDVRIAAAGGNAFPKLYVSPVTHETWLAWRHETIGGLLLNVTTGRQWSLGDVHGNDPIAIGAGAVWYQATPAYALCARFLLAPNEEQGSRFVGRPTGLAGIDALVCPLLIDDVRLSVPGMGNPQRAGRCVVGENADAGPSRNIARLDDGREAILWPGKDSFTPRIATDGHSFAVATWGGPGVRLALLTDPPDFRPVVVPPLPPDPPAPVPPPPPVPPKPMPKTYTLDEIEAVLSDDVPEDLFLGALVRYRNEVCLDRDRVGPPEADTVTGGALLFFARGFSRERNKARFIGATQVDAAVAGFLGATHDYKRAVGLSDPQ